jgi:poly(3-hydroxybutyrate) depolymerase
MRIIIALVVSAAVAYGQKIGEVERVAPTPKAPRGETLEWSSSAGQPYWYRLPKDISQSRPPRLIFMLHGTGLNHGWSFWNYGIGQGGFRKDDIVVSPDGVTPGQGSTFNFVQGKKDGDQIEELIRLFQKQFPTSQVYLYGHSQGAFFCYWFAGEYPELVDGIVAHAGNVLSVQHPKLAKSKVAVAILHAESDPVVTVECAYRTHQIYKEQGYEKLKLEVVKGIREEAGHWPLPDHVKALLEWCDTVSVLSAGAALGVATTELDRETPNLLTVTDALARAEQLMKKASSSEKKELEGALSRVQAAVERAVVAHGKALADSPAVKNPRAPFDASAAHFRTVNTALADHPGWKKTLGPLVTRAARDEKAIEKAIARVNSSIRSFGEGVKAVDGGFLAPSYPELVGILQRLSEGEGVDPKARAHLQKLVAERQDATVAGEAAAAQITQESLKSAED